MKPGDRVEVSSNFPESKLRILRLKIGDKGTVRFVMRARPQSPGIAIVDWGDGRRTNANEEHLAVLPSAPSPRG